MLIFSFGSGFNLETADPVYLAKIKMQVEYARTKGIEVGGYVDAAFSNTRGPGH